MKSPLVSVNVGLPRRIGIDRGETVISGIVKSPVRSLTVRVGTTNIEGDGQADLRAHGGIDKAIYAYSRDHWRWWETEHGLSCTAATFGENLTLSSVNEESVGIGDQFRWGDVLLEVSQPRGPCYKLAMHTSRKDVPVAMTTSARCGFYLRVLEEGDAPVAGELVRVRASGEPSVKEAFAAAYHRDISHDRRMRVHDAHGLAYAWREGIARRLALSTRE